MTMPRSNPSITAEMVSDHEKVVATPDEFVVFCPQCNDTTIVEMEEQIEGGFEPSPSEQFMKCRCGKLLEVIGRWRNIT